MKDRSFCCPICQKSSAFDESNSYRPFCSERCKIQDIANWSTENYKVVKPLHHENLD